MANPRPTFQQRLFSDEDLPLPLHDRIVRWADVTLRTNPSPFLRELGIEHQVTSDGCVGWLEAHVIYETPFERDEATGLLCSIAQRYLPEIPLPPKIEVSNPRWEPILKDDRGVIVGAVDLATVVEVRRPEIVAPIWKLNYKDCELESKLSKLLPESGKLAFYNGSSLKVDGTKIDGEVFVDDFPKDVIGCMISRKSVQFLGQPYISSYVRSDGFSIYVEAKTKIRSAGEVLRQINLYRSVVRSGSSFVVVAPTDAWEPDMKAILREQGVGTVDFLSN